MDTGYEEIIYGSVFHKNTTKHYGTLAYQLAKICDQCSLLQQEGELVVPKKESFLYFFCKVVLPPARKG
jgi:hypothetical protein